MIRSKIKILVSILGILVAQACSHTAEKKLDTQIAQQPQVANTKALSNQIRGLIEASTTLSSDQKTNLLSLQSKTRAQMLGNHEQSLKLRSLLVQELIQANYDEPELRLLKSRLKDNEELRLSLIFDAVDKANIILGHGNLAHAEILRSFYENKNFD